MAAPITSARTPKRIYSLSNSCCLCSFSFVIKEIGNNGEVCVKKLFKLKLRLTDERKKIVQEVVDIPPSGEGVCVKCFAKCEKVIKYRKEIDDIIRSFGENRRRFLAKSPGSSVMKRGLRSPQSYPAEVVTRVCKIIDEECSEISKRGSGTCLQGKCFKDFTEFSWDSLNKDLIKRCPHTVQILSSIVNIPSMEIQEKPFFHLMVSSAISLHGRNHEMSAIQYVTAFISARGGYTQRSMEVLCKFGLCVHPYTVRNKLKGWEDKLDEELKELKQKILLNELTFLFATSIIRNIPQIAQHLQNVYPQHIQHKHSHYAAMKTKQYPLGLFDTNENKTDEMIRLLKDLTDRYVPLDNDNVADAVFFGGDRLTDERDQCAQVATKDSSTSKGRLEGFISKSEDFHRLMNLMEAIFKLTYSTESAADPCTVHYYRNILGYRNVKGPVKNACRAYKLLYYTIGDAICVAMFRNELGTCSMDVEDELTLPDLSRMSVEQKKEWLNGVCEKLVKKWFFEESDDVFQEIREVLENAHPEENYWTSTLESGRFRCHQCSKEYKRVSSLKAHESEKHKIPLKHSTKKKRETKDEVHCYIMMLFKLVMLHRNFDSAFDMGDGSRCVRSAKYELPIYHKTHKIKYTISSIHTIAMSSGLLNPDQEERFIGNRFVKLQGGVNSNIALDEYKEMINRDTKASCTGHKTKESILRHSKEYPLLVQLTNQLEAASSMGTRKGFHHLPSYCSDVQKVAKDLLEHDIFRQNEYRKLNKKTSWSRQKSILKLYKGPFGHAS
ncbi:hypothetical protein FSP39_011873 [Pinctada imbricata]|uniref:C2H2-type domain-containing protein n=1 Tax=Pinctada imbricata TaxID=66713 RepID=A0AA88XE81_PINIB|nr:hypothetical protein FSP39_011873 [Pinctada imbricata]